MRLPFAFVAQPPLSGLKLYLTFPLLCLYVWKSLIAPLGLGPLGPYAALGLAIVTLGAQCYSAAIPLAGSIYLLAVELGDIVDAAFEQMCNSISFAVKASLSVMGLPPPVEAKVVSAVARPPIIAINIVRGLMPDFGALFPPSWRDGNTLSPIMFVILLVALILLQALPLMLFGLAGSGDLVIYMCMLICCLIATLALNAHKVIQIVIAIFEGVINFLLQFLLRRIINVRALQALLDLAHDPLKALGLAKRAHNPPTEPGTIVLVLPLAPDKTSTTSASLVQEAYASDESAPASKNDS